MGNGIEGLCALVRRVPTRPEPPRHIGVVEVWSGIATGDERCQRLQAGDGRLLAEYHVARRNLAPHGRSRVPTLSAVADSDLAL